MRFHGAAAQLGGTAARRILVDTARLRIPRTMTIMFVS
jgi:hypothetical protein